MTRINKLTQNPELLADDLFVIWDNDNQRTRSITAETLNKFTDAQGVNANAFVNGYIQDGILYMVRANDEVVTIGSITGVELLLDGNIPKVESGKLVASAIKETDDAVVFTKDIIAPQESVFVGPAVKISDKGGYLGIDNIADDRESTPVVSFVYETEAERDAIFTDGVSVPRYRYFVPAKWVYQFPFEAEYSNANKLSFEFQDNDNTLIRKFRMFSKKAQSGVRIWIENLLPSGDAMVWENVTEDDFNEGKGQDFVAQGDTDQFTLVEPGLVKISTANIRFRFNVQAQPGENLELQGQEIDLGFGTGFYPRMVTYTQDEKDLDLLDSIETSQNRFGQFGEQFRIETPDIVARDLGDQAEAIPQGIFDTAITSDRPEAIYVNGDKPIQINAITVKHIGTWSPVQVSLNDDRTQVVDLVDGDNTITFTKPLTVEANQSVYFRFTGAVGTGSQTQISLRGDAQQEIYYKLDITELEEKTVTVDGVESVVAGNKIFVDDSDPKNPIVSWDPSGDLLPGVNIDKEGVQVLSAADTLNFSSAFNVTKAKDTGGTVNIELSTTARGTNEVGVFESTTDLLAAYPTPEDGLYARVLQDNNNLPDDRYESKGGNWVGMGGVAGQVIVDDNKSLGLIMGDGLKAEDDGGSAKISLDGNTPVLTFDVTTDSTRSVDTSYVGKIISIIQTPPSISIPMQITLVDHSQFKTGDTIKIAADRDGDNAYKNYYFAVYFNDASGRNIAKYPANNITMVRTDTAWDVQLDGRFTNVSIRPKSQFNIPYAPDEQYNTPVNAFVFAESDAVSFDVDDDTNTRIVKVDLDSVTDNYIAKYSRADTDYVQVAYQGKYGDERVYHPISINQDSNGYTFFKFTGYMEFVPRNKSTGTDGSSVLELREDRIVNKQEPYYNDKKIAVQESDVEFTKLQVQRSGRDFPPVSLFVDGYMNTIMEANGEFKLRFLDADGSTTQTLQASTSKWNFLARPKYNNVNLVTNDEVYDIINDAIEPGSGMSANSIRVARVTGYTNNYTSITYVDDKIEGFKFGKDNSLFEIICYANSKNGYIMIHKDNVSASIGRDVDDGDLTLGVNTSSDAKISIGKYGQNLPTPVDEGVIAKISYNYYAMTMKLDNANQDANDPTQFLKSDGTITTDVNEAQRMGYSPMSLKLNKSFNGREWGYSLIRGYIKSDKTFEADITSPYYVMSVTIGTSLTLTKQHTAGMNVGSLIFYNNPLDASLDQNPLVRADSVTESIEENNDEIITPNKGEQFQIIDSEKSSSYGNASKKVTYFQPAVGTQSAMLLSNLDYGKAFAIHEQVNSTKLIMILHESLVAEIYNRDLTDVNELTMLFTGDSRGRLSKANQTADAQFAINWNGELIPATEDANELNPTMWVAQDDSVTENWSTSVKSVCYSSGVLANRGSAMLKRGDVIYSKPESLADSNEPLTENPRSLSQTLSDSGETATITYDNDSEFFVMPIIAGGGTFSVMKVFQLFMSRKYQTVNEWGSFKFDESSDCIGTILKIAYDAAIAEEEKQEQGESIQKALFKMAVDSQNKYGTQLVVDLTGD